jgi:hypothetical protein
MAKLTNTKETTISVLVLNQQRVLQEYLDDVTLQELSWTLLMVYLGKHTGRHKELLINGWFNDAVIRSDYAVQ